MGDRVLETNVEVEKMGATCASRARQGVGMTRSSPVQHRNTSLVDMGIERLRHTQSLALLTYSRISQFSFCGWPGGGNIASENERMRKRIGLEDVFGKAMTK
jgi:hypothetical protein